MKTIRICVLFCFLPLFAIAQDETNRTFLFEKFENGTANYKNGSVIGGLFNYNLLSGKIMFEQNGTVFELADLSSIVSVKMNNRIFIQIKPDIFCERFMVDDVELCVYWKIKTQSAGKKGAYGTVSQTSSIIGISQITQDGSVYNFQSGEEYTTSESNIYYIYLNDKYNRIDSPKSLGKLFKNHQKEIEDYCNQEKISFTNFGEIKKAVAFCEKYSN
jgi:hypothetical protein